MLLTEEKFQEQGENLNSKMCLSISSNAIWHRQASRVSWEEGVGITTYSQPPSNALSTWTFQF